MKKLLSTVLALMMLLTMLPIGASAAETGNSERDALLSLACAVFPEYADSIRGEARASYSRSANLTADEVVFRETRSVNENESIGIIQYASGVTIVVHSDSNTFTVQNPSSSSSTVGTDIVGTASFTVAASGVSGLFKLSNVGYIINQSGSKYFTSYGTATVTNSSIKYTRTTANTSLIEYTITFASNAIDTFSVYFYGSKLIATMGPY